MNPLGSQPEIAVFDRPFPRLSISHLLLLTLMIGFSFGCVAPQIQETLTIPNEVFRGRKWHSIGGIVAELFSTGIKLFGLIVLTRQWLRGQAWRLAPGHWLLIALGPIALFNLISHAASHCEVWFGDYWRMVNASRHAIAAGVWLLSALVALRAVPAQSQWRWRIVLVTLAALLFNLAVWHAWRASTLYGHGAGLSFFARHVLATWGNLHVCLAALCLLSASIDFWNRTWRDWLHYYALAAILLDATSIVLSFGPFMAQWWSDLFSHVLS